MLCRQRTNPQVTEQSFVTTAPRSACSAVTRTSWLRHSRFISRVASLFVLLIVSMASATGARAQSIVLDGPAGLQLANLTPKFTVRARGFAADDRPLVYTIFVTRNSTGDGPYVETLTLTTSDTVVTTFLSRLLPDSAIVFWKARVISASGRIADSPISSAKQTPKWLRLLTFNSPLGDQDSSRTPTFRWESGALDPEFGSWLYTVEILRDDRAEQSKVGFPETFFKSEPLSANTPYQWQVTAFVARSNESVTVRNRATFFIVDPALPTTTLLYQNFPNPFPSATSQSTCFWFDVQSGGSRVSIDIVDLRGSLVRVILPPTVFEGGVYGRGPVGAASNCDNRFIWNGTSSDGRTVPGGVYLARFNATGLRTTFKKIVFRGR